MEARGHWLAKWTGWVCSDVFWLGGCIRGCLKIGYSNNSNGALLFFPSKWSFAIYPPYRSQALSIINHPYFCIYIYTYLIKYINIRYTYLSIYIIYIDIWSGSLALRYYNKNQECQAVQPGGYCPGVVPNGNGTCTWNYEEAGGLPLVIVNVNVWRNDVTCLMLFKMYIYVLENMLVFFSCWYFWATFELFFKCPFGAPFLGKEDLFILKVRSPSFISAMIGSYSPSHLFRRFSPVQHTHNIS